MNYRRILREIALTIFVFGLMVWSYVVIVQITHPEWLDTTLAHYHRAPFSWRVDDVGIVAFALSALGFLFWRLLKE
jgi:hypothetical protein